MEDALAQRKLDYTTLGVVGVLLALGAASMYSATYDAGASLYFRRQLLWGGVGVLLMFSVMLIPFRTLQLLSYPLYVLSLLMLLGVLVFGKTVAGSTSWFGFGTMGLQPSEFAKATTVLALATYLSSRHVTLHRFKNIVVAGGIVFLPMSLILVQPDVGTALIYVGILVIVFYWAGASPLLLLAIVGPGIAAVAALFSTTAFVMSVFSMLLVLLLLRENKFVSSIVFSLVVLVGVSVQYIYGKLQPYQQRRIDTFLDPEADPLGAGYNVIQSKIAIGSGGLFGKGFLEGTQTQLNFLPAQWTDFIFCVPAEEFGFLGASIILISLMVLMLRGVHIASTVKNPCASLLAIGVVATFGIHIVINIGMSMGMLPVVGIPLPFLSYGGSSLITNLLMVGLLLNLYLNRKEY